MIEKLQTLTQEYEMLEASLGDPKLLNDQTRYRETMQRYSELQGVVRAFQTYQDILGSIDNAREALSDPELEEMAREELEALEPQKEAQEARLEALLLPKDPFDDKNVIVEIRAAAGGDEASLFAAEVFEMYRRYADELSFKSEVLDTYPSSVGGVSKGEF